MGLANTTSAVLNGVEADLVVVEASIGTGLPGTYIGGLADASIAQARDRVKLAATASGCRWPRSKVVVNLSPASLRKTGAQLDLALCVSVLAAQDPLLRCDHAFLIAELALDGSLRKVPGVVAALIAAQRDSRIHSAVIPTGNAREAAVLPKSGITVYCATHLGEVLAWCRGEQALPTAAEVAAGVSSESFEDSACGDMCDVVGQHEAKRAAEIAAAGGHHLMMIGPPGSGKTMIAQRLVGLLPALTPQEQLEATTVHSIIDPGGQARARPPYVACHHGVTKAALIGGGSGRVRPGAVSLAHTGVLFLDEVSEISAHVLDMLRGPMELQEVRLVRAGRTITFPARFQLVMAANPCRCGAADIAQCTCSVHDRATYLKNLSGPLRDRLDLVVATHPAGAIRGGAAESSATIAERVQSARERAQARWLRALGVKRLNAELPGRVLRREFAADAAGMALLEHSLSTSSITQRGVDRCLRLAWTLADLAEAEVPDLGHIAEALELHQHHLGTEHDAAAAA